MDWENIFALQISGKKLYPIYVCVCVWLHQSIIIKQTIQFKTGQKKIKNE